MATIAELRTQRGALTDKLVTLTENAAEFEACERELTDLNGTLERALRAQNAAAATAKPVGHREGSADPEDPAKGFRSLGEQLQAVRRADLRSGAVLDPRLKLARSPTGASEVSGPDGGYMVQTDFVPGLIQNVWDTGEILSRVRRVPVGPNANGVKMLGLDETSRANGMRYGGIQAFWTAEAGLKQASNPKFKEIKLDLDKLTALCYATDELLEDAVALQSIIETAFQDEFTFKAEDAVVNGMGVGMPLGILNSGALITVAPGTGQAGTKTVNAANILAMWQHLPPRSMKTAVWLVNVEVLPWLMQLYTPVTNSGGAVVAAVPTMVSYVPRGVNGSEYATLNGAPVIPVEYAAGLGTPGDIILADLSQYVVIDKGDMKTDISMHVRFIYDETCFRFVYRINGQPLVYTPTLPYKGTNVLSPFIVLGPH